MKVNPNMANREVCDLVFTDFKSGVPFLNVDYANVTTYEVTGEGVYAYGGQGRPKRIAFYGEKDGTIVFETQIQPFKLYSFMTGAAIQNTAKFLKREEHTVDDVGLVITLSGVPVEGSGVNVFEADDDCGTPVEATVEGETVTVSAPGDYIVYYMEEITENVKRLNIKSTTFPRVFTAFGSTYNKTEDDEILPYKMMAYKCQPRPNFTISNSNSGDPATLTVTCDLLADNDGNMLDLILIEEEE